MSGSNTTASRRTPIGIPSSISTSASPTRETLPAATIRGSSHNLPSASRPLAGFSTPSTSFGSSRSGDITTPRLINAYGTVVETVLPSRLPVIP